MTAPPPSFTAQKPQIDMDVLAALPKEIREEMMQRYGLASGVGWEQDDVIELSDDEESVVGIPILKRSRNGSRSPEEALLSSTSPNSQCAEPAPSLDAVLPGSHAEIRATKFEGSTLPTISPVPEQGLDGLQDDLNSSTSDDDEDEDGSPCSRCGSHVFGFAADAHARWHEQTEEAPT